jgi:hypothetical protein
MDGILAVIGIYLATGVMAPDMALCPPAGPGVAESVTANLTVPPPDTPKGPSQGMVGQKLTYTTKGTDPLNAHLYRFDWGDGTISKWASSTKGSHVYTATGRYTIIAQEKCPLGLFITDWSKGRNVDITPNILKRQGHG